VRTKRSSASLISGRPGLNGQSKSAIARRDLHHADNGQIDLTPDDLPTGPFGENRKDALGSASKGRSRNVRTINPSGTRRGPCGLAVRVIFLCALVKNSGFSSLFYARQTHHPRPWISPSVCPAWLLRHATRLEPRTAAARPSIKHCHVPTPPQPPEKKKVGRIKGRNRQSGR